MQEESHMLYIPMGVKTEYEFFSGFGKKEVWQAAIGGLLSGVVSLFIYLLCGNVVYTMISLLSGFAGSVMMTAKDQYNLSVVTQLSNLLRFAQSQKVYFYCYGDEWEG